MAHYVYQPDILFVSAAVKGQRRETGRKCMLICALFDRGGCHG